MKPDVLVSVVVPAYNAQNSIIACIESVFNQTYPNIEVIVINDGSTDDTRKVLDEYLYKDNLRVLHQLNSGPSVARNVGIQLAKGKYIAFLDSDDKWIPTKIEKQLKFLQENPRIVIIGTLTQNVVRTQSIYCSTIAFCRLLFNNYFTTSTVMCHSKVFTDLKFNEKQKYSEDYRLWLEIVAKYGDGAMLNENLVEWADKKRFGDSGLSASLWNMEKGELSNFSFLYRNKKISFPLLICTITWSLVKYFRRLSLFILNRV